MRRLVKEIPLFHYVTRDFEYRLMPGENRYYFIVLDFVLLFQILLLSEVHIMTQQEPRLFECR